MKEIAVTINDKTLTMAFGATVEDVMRKAGIVELTRRSPMRRIRTWGHW